MWQVSTTRPPGNFWRITKREEGIVLVLRWSPKGRKSKENDCLCCNYDFFSTEGNNRVVGKGGRGHNRKRQETESNKDLRQVTKESFIQTNLAGTKVPCKFAIRHPWDLNHQRSQRNAPSE